MSRERRKPRRVPRAIAATKSEPAQAGRRSSLLPNIPFVYFFAFSLGALIMFLSSAQALLGTVVLYVSLFGVSYGLARAITRWIVLRRMRTR